MSQVITPTPVVASDDVFVPPLNRKAVAAVVVASFMAVAAVITGGLFVRHALQAKPVALATAASVRSPAPDAKPSVLAGEKNSFGAIAFDRGAFPVPQPPAVFALAVPMALTEASPVRTVPPVKPATVVAAVPVKTPVPPRAPRMQVARNEIGSRVVRPAKVAPANAMPADSAAPTVVSTLPAQQQTGFLETVFGVTAPEPAKQAMAYAEMPANIVPPGMSVSLDSADRVIFHMRSHIVELGGLFYEGSSGREGGFNNPDPSIQHKQNYAPVSLGMHPIWPREKPFFGQPSWRIGNTGIHVGELIHSASVGLRGRPYGESNGCLVVQNWPAFVAQMKRVRPAYLDVRYD